MSNNKSISDSLFKIFIAIVKTIYKSLVFVLSAVGTVISIVGPYLPFIAVGVFIYKIPLARKIFSTVLSIYKKAISELIKSNSNCIYFYFIIF